VRSSIGLNVNAVPYLINAPVQSDKTGESVRALNDQLGLMLGKKGVTGEELTRLVSNNVDALPGRFETSGAVLGAMMSNDQFRRPDNYYELLADKYRGLTQAQLDAALKSAVDPKGFTWVVVGDAKQVKPQLDKLGIPVEVIQPR
jgi:predicted Zn-dependent peptidase